MSDRPDVAERLQWAYDHRDDLIEGDPIDMFKTLTDIAAEAWNQLRDERMRCFRDEASAALYAPIAERAAGVDR